jgi:mycothiol synthase
MTGAQPVVLIEHAWFAAPPDDVRQQLAAFAEDAAEYDAEAGFTQITEFRREAVAEPDPAGPPRYLVAWLVEAGSSQSEPAGAPASETRTLAACMTITPADARGTAKASFVVAPALRSRGVATSLVENLLAGVGGSGLSSLGQQVLALELDAAGHHPAAERLARRFDFQAVQERWQVLRLLRDPVGRPELFGGSEVRVEESREAAAAEPSEGAERSLAMARDSRHSKGTVAIVRRRYDLAAAAGTSGPAFVTRVCVAADDQPSRLAFAEWAPPASGAAVDDATLDAIVEAALSDLWAAGARAVLAEIDPGDAAVVAGFRRQLFQHDQTNLTFRVPARDRSVQAVG